MAKATILQYLIQHLDLNNYRFEQEIKASNGSIKKLMETNGDISENLIKKITERFPQVNSEWLRGNRAKMIIKATNQKKEVLDKLNELESNIYQIQLQIREIKKLV